MKKNYNIFDLHEYLAQEYPNNTYMIKPFTTNGNIVRKDNILYFCQFAANCNEVYPSPKSANNYGLNGTPPQPIIFHGAESNDNNCWITGYQIVFHKNVT